MDDLISRQAAIDAADKIIERDTSGNNAVVNAMIAWSEYIKALPSAHPERGRWILTQDDEREYCTCSNCGYQNGENWMIGSAIPFCEMCGAKMD